MVVTADRIEDAFNTVTKDRLFPLLPSDAAKNRDK